MRIQIPKMTFVVIAVFITCGTCQEKSFSRDIGDALEGASKTFLVTCEGLCKDVTATIKVDSGDPDLFAREEEPPIIVPSPGIVLDNFCHSKW